MSVEAVSWALNDAPDVPASCLAVLIGLANHAHADGRAAFPSYQRLAFYARKSVRAVQNDLAALARLGLIRRGDQRHTAFLPADRRPAVWDLALERRRALPGGLDGDARSGRPARRSGGVVHSRGEARYAPPAQRGEARYPTGRSPVPDGVNQASHKPSLNHQESIACPRGPQIRPPSRNSAGLHRAGSGASRCPLHVGELAGHCRPCASERKAAR
ncbi:hypothetical protein CS0771_57070 [Catellatospora sp. IY07-71]|uniref:helix-turn-helix domain-containing protein n=1 Tax=Catellatospora sp. IY07-71 TaxID=2728827 RepID=UPI001BB72AD7|nr:hypothetical protein CS0771_57070 [Catellatospora sp. IY07-71]